jgi:hypothetical protein
MNFAAVRISHPDVGFNGMLSVAPRVPWEVLHLIRACPRHLISLAAKSNAVCYGDCHNPILTPRYLRSLDRILLSEANSNIANQSVPDFYGFTRFQCLFITAAYRETLPRAN